MNNPNGASRFPPRAVAHDMGEFAHDVVTLAELQIELAKVDLQHFAKRLLLPGVLLVSAAGLTLASCTVLLLCVTVGLIEAGLAVWLALLIATGCGLLLAALLAGIGWLGLRRSQRAFQSSRSELSQNLAWIKQVLKHGRAHSR